MTSKSVLQQRSTMICKYKYQFLLLLDAILLVFSIIGIVIGCVYEIQWLIISGVLGIAITVLIGVILRDQIKRVSNTEIFTIENVIIIH